VLDSQPKDEPTVKELLTEHEAIFDMLAAGLYNMASMLVGEGEDSIRLVETAVERAELSQSGDAEQARKSSRLALSRAALEMLSRRASGSLAAPQDLVPTATCIQDDDLDAGGVSTEELAKLMAGPEKERVRTWLTSLRPEFRVVFVLRAVAGFNSPEVADLLAACGGPTASGWTAADVREVFRQALCSLASQVIHATTAR
jgi:DNA-directed RNA polymerase specialized sigma24 family protein